MKYCIVSFAGYPGGGGEAFLHQTMIWMKNMQCSVYWLSFAERSGKLYETFKAEFLTERSTDPSVVMLKIPGGIGNLGMWLRLIHPDVVHHQGSHREIIVDACRELRIPIITGYHFWTGAIELNPSTFNREIRKNISGHKPCDELERVMGNPHVTTYACSEFLRDIVKDVTGKTLTNIIYPSSGLENRAVKFKNPRYVTLVNIHKMKGGEIFLELLKKLPQIPFLGVRYEPHSEELDEEIKRNLTGESKIIEFTPGMKDIYADTKILLVPSIVDETFCRVANEGLMNGIPMITTGAGAIRDMLGDSALYLGEDPQLWVDAVRSLYGSKKRITTMSKKALSRYQLFSEDASRLSFVQMTTDAVKNGPSHNIMFVAPWCDQGLGIQVRNYVKMMPEGYHPFVFSYKPYNGNGDARSLQKDPKEWEWEGGPIVYYSRNDREHIRDNELWEFVCKYNIGTCIIPETCWARVFEIARMMHGWNVRMIAIPNIEIVRRDELHLHGWFDEIACNNKLCSDIFSKYLSREENGHNPRIYSLGYGLRENFREKTSADTTRFLCVGGMNAFTRKNCYEVLQAFVKAKQTIPNISLTLTVQKYSDDRMKEFVGVDGIRIIDSHLTYEEILDLYYTHDICIQVSKHEGLGLGFYESIATGTPVLTLDTPPHNEIINDGINGWTIPCGYVKMTDNPQGLFESAVVSVDVLANGIIRAVKEPINQKKLRDDFRNNHSDTGFIEQFKTLLVG